MEYKTTLPAFVRIEDIEEQKRYDKDATIYQIINGIVKAAFGQYFTLDADKLEVFFEEDKASDKRYMNTEQEFFIVARASRAKGFPALEFENMVGEDFKGSDYNKIGKIARMNNKPITSIRRPLKFSYKGKELKYRGSSNEMNE